MPGGGTFVGEVGALGQGLLKAEKLRRLRPLADQLVTEAAQLLLLPKEIHKLLDTALAAQQPRKTRSAATSGKKEEA